MRVPLLLVVGCATLASVVPVAAEDLPLAARIEAVAPSIVVVRGVLKVRWSRGEGTEEQETAIDSRGVIVDPSGVVLLEGSVVGGDYSALRKWRESNPGSTYESAPSHLEVLFGPEMKEHRAVVLLQDSRLDLAFLLIPGLDGKTLPHVDLSVGGSPRLGDTLVGVTRRARGFDYAPEAMTLYATSRIEKPRAMWAIAGDFDEVGLPVFDLAGKTVGVTLQQDTSADADENTAQETFLLPLDAVRRSLEAAKKRIPEVLAKEAARAESGADPAPKDAPTPAPPGSAEPPKAPDAPKAPETPKDEARPPETPKEPDPPKQPGAPKDPESPKEPEAPGTGGR